MYLLYSVFTTFIGVIYLLYLDMADANSMEERILSIFPHDYNKDEPPWKRGKPAHINIALFVMDIDHINDGNMEYSIQFYISEIWKDDRLNLTYFLDGSDYPSFPVELASYLWVPDLVFDNAKKGKLFQLSLPNTDISIRTTGVFERSSRYNLVVGCPMDFYYYPMDTQECYMKMATLKNPDYKVTLHWILENTEEEFDENIELMYPIQPLKYAFKDPESEKVVQMWEDGNYTFLNAKFTFTRRISASIFNVYIPSTLVVLLSWISFWVDIEAVPARVTLGVTSLLTLSTQVMEARAGLPPISYMTAMDVWLFACLITVFSVLLEFAFAYQIFISHEMVSPIRVTSLEKNTRRTPKYVRKSSLAVDITKRRRTDRTSSELVSKTDAKYLDKHCRKIFPFLFLLFALIYWVYFLYLK